ncbi:MAG: O-antigen ligase family protein [Planctomycetota bacterium]
MNRIEQYLQVIPLPVLVLGVLGAPLVFVLIPSRLRMPALLVFMVVWLTIGRLVGLGPLAAAAKATGLALYAAVGVAALMDPGPKRPVPAAAFIYPVMGVISVAFILTVVDLALALVLRAQWIALVFAAIAVARTVVDSASLMRVLWALVIGMALATAIPLIPLFLNPANAFRAGLGRFEPYGAVSNQIGVLFSMTIVFGFCMMQITRNMLFKLFLGGAAGAAFGMGLLTGSRSTMLTAVVPLIPQIRGLSKRPLVLVMIGLVGVLLIPFVLSKAEDTAFQRFDSLETTRVQIFFQYLQGSIAERPLLGLTGSSGQSFLADEEADSHAHNAYLDLAYQGGIVYLIPMLAVLAYSSYCAFYTWRYRRHVHGIDPLLVSVLVVQLGMMYAHGFVNGAIYYPTYTWAFLHVFLSVLFMGLAHDIKRGGFGIYADSYGSQLGYDPGDDQGCDQGYDQDGDPQHDDGSDDHASSESGYGSGYVGEQDAQRG